MNRKRLAFIPLAIIVIFSMVVSGNGQKNSLKVGVIGLTHTHVHWIFNSVKNGDFEIVGVAESNQELAQQYAEQYSYPMEKVYSTMDELLAAETVEAVCAFGTIFEHLEVVEKAAPKGIHVMVEKPLAVSLEHARQMEQLAKQHNIQLLTNYETTWYPSNHKAYELLEQDSIGELRKVVIRDGHRGPKKIGVNKEFLEWLVDPVQNGGGAITDFGCYGANLITWLMKGERPLFVTAVTQQMQPENNPLVDDDATIIVQYKNTNAIIQASWDWPIGRKDMEIYGLTGVLYSDNYNNLRMRTAKGYDGFSERKYVLEERKAPYNDPFSLFVAVINNDITLSKYDLSSLENNMIVMEILDAAVKSAKRKKTIEIAK